MSNLKKILTAMLAVMLVLSTITVPVVLAADDTTAVTSATSGFNDVSSSAYYGNAVAVLSKLGVITGYPDGTFKPDNNVTRAEFTAMLMRTLGLGSLTVSADRELPFSDISSPDVSWAIPNIIYAYDMGIINGYPDGTFDPSANVTFEQATKMIVCAIGYEKAALDLGGPEWYSGYMRKGTDLGITKNTPGTIGEPATRAMNAEMLFDSLEIDLMQLVSGDASTGTYQIMTGKSILTEKLKLIKNKGIISANNFTGLDTPLVTLKEDEVQITATEPGASISSVYTYKTSTPELRNLLGSEVTFYYSQETGADSRTLVLANVTKGTSVEIPADSLVESGSTATSIRYYKNKTTDTNPVNLNLATDNKVVYNGKLYGSGGTSSRFDTSMLPLLGSLKAIDSNNDGSYETVFIDSYEPYVVSTVDSSTYSIIDNILPYYSNGTVSTAARTLTIDPEETDITVEIVNKSGTKVSFSSIKKWDVVCVKESKNTNGKILLTAVVVTDVATGTVNEVGTETVRIGDKTYDFSPYAPFVIQPSNTATPKPTLSESGTYYLDIEGNVIAYDKKTSAAATYGYLMGALPPSSSLGDGSDRVRLNILTQSGSKQDLSVAKTVTIDGESVSSSSTILDRLFAAANSSTNPQNNDSGRSNADYTQVIKYTTTTQSGATVVDSIITINNSSSALTHSTDTTGKTFTYSSSNQTLTANESSSVTVGLNGAYVFVVPSNRKTYDDYRRGTVSGDFRNKKDTYVVEAYDLSSSKIAKVVVLYGASAVIDINSSTPVMMFDSISQATSNGETLYKVKVATFNPTGANSPSTSEIWLERGAATSEAQNLKKGDLFRAGYNASQQINDIKIISGRNEASILDEVANYDSDDVDSSKRNAYDAEYKIIRGSVYSVDKDDNNEVTALTMIEDVLASGTSTPSGSAERLTIQRRDFSSALFYEYTFSGSTTTITGPNDASRAPTEEAVINGAVAFEDIPNSSSKPTQLFIYMSGGAVKLVVKITR